MVTVDTACQSTDPVAHLRVGEGAGARSEGSSIPVEVIRRDCADFLRETGMSNAAMSKASGMSTATVSLFLSGKYTGDNDAVAIKLRAVIDRERERRAGERLPCVFVETRAALRMIEAAKCAHGGDMVVCAADAGLGKTEAVREYARRNPGVVLIEADPGYSAMVLFSRLYAMVCTGSERSLHGMFEGVVDKMTGSGRLIIIDEAEQLPVRALEMLRRVHDHAGIGILMTGMPRLIANICGNRREFAQIFSRIRLRIKLEPMTINDVRLLVAAHAPEAEPVAGLLLKESKGNPRRMMNIIRRGKVIARINNTTFTADVVNAAVGLLID